MSNLYRAIMQFLGNMWVSVVIGIAALILLVLFGFFFNCIGWGGVNFFIIFLLVPTVAALSINPDMTVSLFAAAIASGTLQRNTNVQNELKTFFMTYLKFVKSFILSILIIFIFLGVIPFKENPKAFFALMALCTAISISSSVWGFAAAGWGKKIIFWSLIIITIITVGSLIPDNIYIKTVGFTPSSVFTGSESDGVISNIKKEATKAAEKARVARLINLQDKINRGIALSPTERAEYEKAIKEAEERQLHVRAKKIIEDFLSNKTRIVIFIICLLLTLSIIWRKNKIACIIFIIFFLLFFGEIINNKISDNFDLTLSIPKTIKNTSEPSDTIDNPNKPPIKDINIIKYSPQLKTLYVANTELLNLRKCPGKQCDEIGMLKRNEMVTLLGENTNIDGSVWEKVNTNYGQGWVNKNFLNNNLNTPNIADKKKKNNLITQSVLDNAKKTVDSYAKNPEIYTDWNACPGEGCLYPLGVVAKRNIAVHYSPNFASTKIVTVTQGERLIIDKGMVLTTTPGKYTITKPTTIADVQALPGDVVYTYTYRGEGYSLVWFKGQMKEAFVGDEMKLEHKAESIWWVYVRTHDSYAGWVSYQDSDMFEFVAGGGESWGNPPLRSDFFKLTKVMY